MGGNFHNPQEHFGVVQEVGEDITLVAMPDISQLLEISAVATPVPSVGDHTNTETIEDCKKL